MSFRRLFDRKGCERGLKKLLCLFFAVFLAASLAACGNSKSSSSAAAASTGGYDSEGVPEAGANSAALSKVDEIERKLVYRADVSAETKDFERAKADLDAWLPRCRVMWRVRTLPAAVTAGEEPPSPLYSQGPGGLLAGVSGQAGGIGERGV